MVKIIFICFCYITGRLCNKSQRVSIQWLLRQLTYQRLVTCITKNFSRIPGIETDSTLGETYSKIGFVGAGGWIGLIVGFQPLMIISTTASWIRWCVQVYACDLMWTCLVLGRTIYARQFWGAKPPTQFRHRWAERNHSGHLYWLRAAQF